MTEAKPATVRYVGLHTGGPLLIRMPDDTTSVVFPGGKPLETTKAHAAELVQTASWEPVKKGSDG